MYKYLYSFFSGYRSMKRSSASRQTIGYTSSGEAYPGGLGHAPSTKYSKSILLFFSDKEEKALFRLAEAPSLGNINPGDR